MVFMMLRCWLICLFGDFVVSESWFVHSFLQRFEVAISKRRDLLLTRLAVRTTAFWNRWPFENCRAAFTCSPLWALTRQQFARSVDRRGAGPRMAAVLGRRSSARPTRWEHAVPFPVAAKLAPSRLSTPP